MTSDARTYTLGGGDVHVAADEGQTIVHAHLKINHPEAKQQTGPVSLFLDVTACLRWNSSEALLQFV